MVKIAVASGKGGTGKTFISTNIFHSLLDNNVSAELIDCDAEAPNAIPFFNTDIQKAEEVNQHVPVIDTDICTFCGKCHDYCNYNAIFILPEVKVIKVIEDLCHDCGACYYACKYGAITEKSFPLGKITSNLDESKNILIEAKMNIGVLSPVRVIQAAIKSSRDNNGITVLDSPPGTSCPFIQTVSAADYVILVTEPTPFGLSDLRQSVDTLRELGKPFGVIINRAGIGNDDVESYLTDEKIELLLEVPFSKDIASAYSKGLLISGNNKMFSRQLYEITMKIAKRYGNSNNKR